MTIEKIERLQEIYIDAIPRAVSVLMSLLIDPRTTDAVRVSIAKEIISSGQEWLMQSDEVLVLSQISDRLNQLEVIHNDQNS